MQTNSKKVSFITITEILIIVCLAIVPLFVSFPYRVNIFLSWEGAYRLSQGQIPYKDFGMPMGFMYWVVPAIFFKIFGVQMITLVKAQLFLNIISGLAFRAILKNLSVQPGIRLLSVLLYCLSFSFFNFWPWYNHSVIVYEMVGLSFLLKYIFTRQGKYNWVWLLLSAIFIFFSFFTKQDGGGLAFILCCALLLYNAIHEKKWLSLLWFVVSFAIVAIAIIYPFTKYNFGYWFNYGQPPHQSRFSVFEIINEFFYSSDWIKFYLFIILVLVIARFKTWKELVSDKKSMIFLLLTLGILAQATILQVTSYTPPDNNIFFHSFAFAYILSNLVYFLHLDLNKLKPLVVCIAGVLLWWSGSYWKYIQRVLERAAPKTEIKNDSGENIVNRKTYIINPDTSDIPMSEWVFSDLKSFKKIYMPEPAVRGIERLMNSNLVKTKKDLQVLNMTELTPLAAEIPFRLQTGPDYPLWYHLGVGMFNREAKMFEREIANKKYDLVLFEYLPGLNNFYPFRVRDSLLNHYQKIDSFNAPRRGDSRGMIEVFVR